MIGISEIFGKLRSAVLKLMFLQRSPIPLRDYYIGIKEIWKASMQNYMFTPPVNSARGRK